MGVRIVTCRYCKEQLNKEEAVKNGKSSYYHHDCLEEKAQKENDKKKESDEYRSLIEYICKLYKLDAPTGMILKQIRDMREEYGYKLSGIKLSLQYFYETLENPVLDDTGIGIVPYVYEEAKKHYLMKKEVEKSLENYKDDTIQEIVIDLHKKRKSKKNLIDISVL